MLDFFGYYQEGAEKKVQKGVIRTSSLECLERTNLVQSRLALKLLGKQLDGHKVDEGVEKELVYAKAGEAWNANGKQLMSLCKDCESGEGSTNLCMRILLNGSIL